MISLKPYQQPVSDCNCGGDFIFAEFLWQGLHICNKSICNQCKKIRIESLPVNQAGLEQYVYYPDPGLLYDIQGNEVRENWYSSKLKSVAKPIEDTINIEIEVLKDCEEVLLLNTLDIIYGHSLLYLLNLQRLFEINDKPGLIVIIQPMFNWLVPKQNVAEIWTVNLGFSDFNNYYSGLSEKINSEMKRFRKVWLSKGHVIPTNQKINIEQFTGIKPYNFFKKAIKPGITFIWREDPDRLWIRNIYLLKGCKKMGISFILKPLHYLRVVRFLRLIKKKLGAQYIYTVAGLGRSFKLPQFIDDKRVRSFNQESEKQLCQIYAGSVLAIGVHGSSMLMPSAHAGMTISLMPSKRWGNFAEDILFIENDVRLASFQRRIIPLNLSIFDVCDITVDMITGRESFIKKFIHSEEL